MKIEARKLHSEAKLPMRAHIDDAGLDLYSIEGCMLASGERRTVRTGIALSIPNGYAGLIWDKSGLAAKAGLKTMGGVIDASYRGEIQVILLNTSREEFRIEQGMKIAQLLIQKVELPDVCEVSELDVTIRGEGGFGSTGAH